ncbi:Uncharacterised protein [Mycobacteroides abscessus subsp. abscessus]|uniref:hypothetical protein n=1 Tax=Mycobacteroides abscessus TaxID=36809 RepID=UPI00092A2DBF|nr:hypothetical protein [Mycobacteroides abscessus]MBN7564509.1 hypothetical protein [Mycobacteroides abscessus subsp. massiliense]SID68303.1 Uncharacterised protein [Mycobacteroides abscessus subsp. abscessus]SIF77129.1 Uncharacterised protein [Mycobacteroides abscessus subsp. abscessus]SIG16566.1 Uncharacterised protein [Mycobacteroides abscessus subsp. abscessus]SIH64429.1 Uncharacterised protein [Mycobacteroides abscessus subsp. abscessus]
MVIATSGDPIIQVHKNVGEGARSAAAGLPVVNAVGMRAGHAAILDGAIAETRKVLGELARVSDVGAGGAGALGEQDRESGRKFGGVREVRRG